MMIPGRDPPVDGPDVSPRGAKTVVFRVALGVQRNSPKINELHRQDQLIEGPKIDNFADFGRSRRFVLANPDDV
jgi:hypothetical protein